MRTRIPHLPHLIRSAAPSAELVPDRALLVEFVAARSGIAFELLVRRHGPAVWAVCRRHLANEHDAEDAFQATFLVLAKSARRITRHASVGSWLYGVAYRVALKARRTAARRKRVETVVAPTDEPATLPVHPFTDTTAVIHGELERLPDRYRLPLLLCDLEGLSRKEASAQLGWSEGTLSGRLNRARKLLADRLTVRGIAAGVLAAVGAATVPPALATTAAAVGVGLSAIGTPSTAAPETVAALAHGAMRDMTRSFVLKVAGVVLAASVLLGGGLLGVRFDATPQATAAPVPKVEMAKAEDVTDALVELLTQPAVQRELKLSAESRVSLIDGFDKLNEKSQEAMQQEANRNWGGQAGGPLIPQVVVPPLGETGGVATEKYRTGLRELAASALTKGQLARLQQCEVQLLGVNALRLKRVVDELGLTDEQKKAVEKALTPEPMPQQFFGQRGGFGQQVPLQPVPPPGQPALPQVGGPPADNSAITIHTATDEKLAERFEFTAGQKKKWKELNGEKVGFDRGRVTSRCSGLLAQLTPTSPATGAPETAPPIAGPGIVDLPPPKQPLPPPGNPGK